MNVCHCFPLFYFSAKLVSWSVRKITHADLLLKRPRFYKIEPVQCNLYSGMFRLENSRVDFNDVHGELSICIQKF